VLQLRLNKKFVLLVAVSNLGSWEAAPNYIVAENIRISADLETSLE
jgi:hypothetical protein